MGADCPVTESANSDYLIILKFQKSRGSLRVVSQHALQGPVTDLPELQGGSASRTQPKASQLNPGACGVLLAVLTKISRSRSISVLDVNFDDSKAVPLSLLPKSTPNSFRSQCNSHFLGNTLCHSCPLLK